MRPIFLRASAPFDGVNRPGTLTHKVQRLLFDGDRVVCVEWRAFLALSSVSLTMESYFVHVKVSEQRNQIELIIVDKSTTVRDSYAGCLLAATAYH